MLQHILIQPGQKEVLNDFTHHTNMMDGDFINLIRGKIPTTELFPEFVPQLTEG